MRAWDVSVRFGRVTAGFEFEHCMVGLLGGVAGLTVFVRATLLLFGALASEDMVMLRA